MPSSISLQQIVDECRVYPDLVPVLGTAGFTSLPALPIANTVMQKMLARPMNWKFNRALLPSFITVGLQQDYSTSTTNLAWMEGGYRRDINNTANIQPVWTEEAVRDLGVSSWQMNPFNISWIPNSLAIYGTWQANTAYPSGLGVASMPISPIQQIKDANGNYLVVTGYGTSGSVAPAAPANSAAGTTVIDGTVTWTVVDPNGIAIRLGGVPPQSGITWQMNIAYQMKPPIFAKLGTTLDPIPDEYAYMFRQGFFAYCWRSRDPKRFAQEFALWQQDMRDALASADRERDDTFLYPNTSVMGGSPWSTIWPVGPAFPYSQPW